MSGVKGRDGVVHLPYVGLSGSILLAHCDVIGSGRTGQSWRPEEVVDNKVDCIHCIADLKIAVCGSVEEIIKENSVREIQELEDKRFVDAIDEEITKPMEP